MSARKPKGQSHAALRASAEARLGRGPPAAPKPRGLTPSGLLHELEVHQVELELQNEELLRAQQALEEARDQYRDLYDFAPVGYFTFSLAGSITRVNLAGAALLGVDRRDLLHANFSGFVALRDQEAWAGHLERARHDDGVVTGELLLVRPDGSTCPVDVSTVRHRHAGGDDDQASLRSTVTDATERRAAAQERERRLEEQAALNLQLERTQRLLLQADKMVQLDKLSTIGLLAAGVAHELTTPVAYVKSSLQSALGAVEATPEAPAGGAVDGAGVVRGELLECLAEAQHGVEEVGRLVRDLKSLVRVDDHVMRETDLNELSEAMLRVVRSQLGSQAEVVRRYQADLPWIRCCPTSVGQVVLNLLVNAAQALTGPGTITLRTGWNGQEAWLEVEDTGRGIPPADLERIFQPFFTTKPQGVGTGLGLSISLGILASHGGRLEVRSEVGKGSVFRAVLPASGEPGRPKAPEPPP